MCWEEVTSEGGLDKLFSKTEESFSFSFTCKSDIYITKLQPFCWFTIMTFEKDAFLHLTNKEAYAMYLLHCDKTRQTF